MRTSFKTAALACWIALAGALPLSTVSAELRQEADEIAGPGDIERATLQSDIEAILAKHCVEGAYIAVTMGTDTVLARSYGRTPATGEAISGTTKVRLASASKLLTAVTVASLRQAGVVSLEETLGALIPDAPEAWRDIPVWRVLNHTSGLPMVVIREDFNAMDPESLERISAAQVRAMIEDEPRDFKPGEQWRYQQSGYALLAEALAARLGTTWRDLVQTRIVEAAGLRSTDFGNDAAVFEVRDEKVVPHTFLYPELFAPAGGFETTGEDARRLLVALASGQVLTEDSLRSLTNDHRWIETREGDAHVDGYGPGVAVQRFGDTAFFSHSGGGGLADIRFAPERQLGIAVLTNRAGGTGAAIEVADLIATRFLGEPKREAG